MDIRLFCFTAVDSYGKADSSFYFTWVWNYGKGQLTSKGLFGVFNSPKKRMKTSRPEVS